MVRLIVRNIEECEKLSPLLNSYQWYNRTPEKKDYPLVINLVRKGLMDWCSSTEQNPDCGGCQSLCNNKVGHLPLENGIAYIRRLKLDRINGIQN